FDSVVLIPKILQCGHTFCSPCVTRVTENNPRCPICGKEINERESSPITNFDTLSVVDIYNSNSNASSIREILTEHWSILVETFRYCDVKHIVRCSSMSSEIDVWWETTRRWENTFRL
ncbi:hypothetical protein Avbf_04422, partial [Armadillidium vulgare]